MLNKRRNVQVWVLKTDGCVIFSRAYNNNIYRTILGVGDEEVAIGLCGYPSCFSILYHGCMAETRIEFWPQSRVITNSFRRCGQPVVHQLSGNRAGVGEDGQMVACKPSSRVQFLLLNMQFTAFILGSKAHHQSARIGP